MVRQVGRANRPERSTPPQVEERTIMRETPRNNWMRSALCACCDDGSSFTATAPSRRRFLQAGAALAATSPLLPVAASAQTTDPELARLQSARRILIKGGVVLTLDREVGDFAT